MFAQEQLRLKGEVHSFFYYNYYPCIDPFIHLLGSSLIQWTIVRINGREKSKQDLLARLGEAMLRLWGEVRLGKALLCLGGLESAETLGSGLPKRSDLCLSGALCLGVHPYAKACTPMPKRRGVEHNAEMARFGPFHRKFPSKPKPTQPKLKINHKTHLIPTNNISNRIFPIQLKQRGISIHIGSILVIHTHIVSIQKEIFQT